MSGNRRKSRKEYIIGAILLFLFAIGAISDAFGAWDGIKNLFSGSSGKEDNINSVEGTSIENSTIIQGENVTINQYPSTSVEQTQEEISTIPSPQETATATIASTHLTSTLRLIDNMEMVFVESDKFPMGANLNDPNAQFDEFPQHDVFLNDYWIDKTEVTNGQFVNFLNENGNQQSGGVDWYDITNESQIIQNGKTFLVMEGAADYPVVLVSWYGADAYCKWVGGALPSEAQWEYAARSPDKRIYAWGNESPNCNRAQYNACSDGTVPVYDNLDGASWIAAFNMSGNVWEWVNDWYEADYYSSLPDNNPQGPITGTYKVMRGGSWDYGETYLRVSYRNLLNPPTGHFGNTGFRCVVNDVNSLNQNR